MNITYRIDKSILYIAIEGRIDASNATAAETQIFDIKKENPDAAILMVTHCRIFPAITRLITLRDGAIVSNEEEYHCYSCFGTPNQDGYYE